MARKTTTRSSRAHAKPRARKATSVRTAARKRAKIARRRSDQEREERQREALYDEERFGLARDRG